MPDAGILDRWYREHLGEPVDPDHVYGYWAFLLGAGLAVVALALFLLSSAYEAGSSAHYLNRQIAFTLVFLAGPVIGLSVVYLLPLQDRAVGLALAGLVVCALAAVAFNVSYPHSWNFGADDRSVQVTTVYAAGIALQLLTVFAYPLATSDTAQPAVADRPASRDGRPDRDGAQRDGSTTDDADSRATFVLYQDRRGEHRWRLRHDDGNLLADAGEGYASRQKARQGVRSVRSNAPDADEEVLSPSDDREAEPAGDASADDVAAEASEPDVDDAGADADDDANAALEPAETDATGEASDEADDASATDDASTAGEAAVAGFEMADPDSAAQFEVYEDRGGKWRWRLRHRNGTVVADSSQGYTDRTAVEDAVDRCKAVAGDADALAYDPAGFECYRDAADDWRWRLRHRNGRILADSGEGYASRRNAREGIERVRTYADAEDRFEVYEDRSGEFRWRLTAPNGEVVADSGQGYASESGATDAVERVREHAPAADALDYDPAAFECYRDAADEWRWRLRHRNGQIVADSSEGYASRQKARQGLDSVQTNAPGASVVEPE